MTDLIIRLVMSALIFGGGLAMAIVGGTTNVAMFTFGCSLMTAVVTFWLGTYTKPPAVKTEE